MAKRSKKNDDDCKPNSDLGGEQDPAGTDVEALARMLLEPHLRHAVTASAFGDKVMGSKYDGVGLNERINHLQTATEKAEAGDRAVISRLLAVQAITLDNMFTELARRAAENMSEYINATERYGRLALKAQANCRGTLEALAKLHQPREQTVRHVHVNEGGQAIVADKLNYHGGGKKNGKSDEQSHATETTSEHEALPCPDSVWQGMPVTGSEREATMQNARRNKPRRA
jgi:hypothetical protein